MLTLWKMHQDVKFLANMFVNERLPILNQMRLTVEREIPISQDKINLENLSNLERMKIFRSIYRYTIYGDLFYVDQSKTRAERKDIALAQDQSHSFLNMFPTWEVEELSCINDMI